MHDPSRQTRDAPARLALVGLAVNAGLGAIKLATGIFGNSFALIADAIESLVDIFASLLVWGAFRYGSKPADEDHPQGHGKIEAIGGLLVSGLIMGAAFGIAMEAIAQIRTPHAPPELFTLPVLLLVIVVKEVLHRRARTAAEAAHSSAGEADAWHHRSDSLTSLVVLFGVLFATLLGPEYHDADDWGALLASFVIAFNAVRLVRLPLAELMDQAEPKVAAKAAATASSHTGVDAIGFANARRSGRGYRVTIELLVDPQMTVEAAYALQRTVEQDIATSHPEVDAIFARCHPNL